MNRILFKLVVVALGLAVVVPAFGQEVQKPEQQEGQVTPPSQPQQEEGIAGVYECIGVSSTGEPYQGIVEIVKNGDTYRLQWTIPNESGNNVYTLGLGIVKGDTFAVTSFGRGVAVVLYKIEADSRLVGEWTMLGADGRTYPETLKKVTDGVLPELPLQRQPQVKPAKTL